MKTRVIPCLLIDNKKLIKTSQFHSKTYLGDPINAVRIFNEKEVDEIIFLDITATYENREPNYKFIESLVNEAFMPFCYGGGICNIEQMRKIFKIGVEKIILNTAAIKNPDLISKAAKEFGNQSIVVSIDAIKYKNNYILFSRNFNLKQNILVKDFISKAVQSGAGEIFLNSVENDGMMNGYDLNLISEISNSLKIPLITCGGAGKIEDFADAVRAGADAVAAGSFFVYIGIYKAVLITYPDYDKLKKILP